MESKIFLWVEDRKGKAGYTFWESMMKQICPKCVVESKKNCSELVKAVKSLEDTRNKYVIVLDNSFDNPQVVMEQKILKQYANKKANIRLLDIICFEYILLEFQDLIKWIYASDDEFLRKRKNVIVARERIVSAFGAGEMNYKNFQEIIEYDDQIEEHNVEQLVAKLLFDLTRNTGFEVSKGCIGECWIKSCCEWENRMDDDVCGLDVSRLSVYEKMKSIYKGTCLKEQFPIVGLEVSL